MPIPAPSKREAHEPDYVILVAVVALSAIGILMVYSASAIPSYAQSQNTFQLVAPQILAGLLGLAAMIFLMRLDYRYLRIASVAAGGRRPWSCCWSLVLIGPAIGERRTTARRAGSTWDRCRTSHPAGDRQAGPRRLPVALAGHSRARRSRASAQGTVPFAIIVIPFLLLVVREPDLGTAARRSS